MKKYFIAWCLFLLSAFLFAACFTAPETTVAEGELYRIGVIHDSSSSEINTLIQKAIYTLAEVEGVEVLVEDGGTDAAKQAQIIDDMIDSGVQGIICFSLDGAQLEPAVQKAVENDIAFISLFNEVPSATVTIRINEYEYGSTAGLLAGKWAQERFPDETVEAAVLRRHDYGPGVDRSRGIREGFAKAFPTGRIVRDMDSHDADTAREAALTILKANPGVRIFITESDDVGGFGVYEALKEIVPAEEQDNYCIIGGDGTTQGIMNVKEGGMYRGNIDIMPLDIGVRAYNNIKDFIGDKEIAARQYVEFLEIDNEIAVRKY